MVLIKRRRTCSISWLFGSSWLVSRTGGFPLRVAFCGSAKQTEHASIIKLQLIYYWSACSRNHQCITLPPLSTASSLMAHRFVTVRRGSPAARSGQIQPGDRLEAVEGRPVGGLQHRDLSQILRRAGNTLRLSITPKQRTDARTRSPTHRTHEAHAFLSSTESSSDGADLDTNGRLIKGPRGRSKVTFV